MRRVKKGATVHFYFKAFDGVGNPLTAKDDTYFTKKVTLDGSPSSTPVVTINEVSAAQRPGEYRGTFTAPSTATDELFVDVSWPEYPQGLIDQYVVEDYEIGDLALQADLAQHDADIKALEPHGTAMRGTDDAALASDLASHDGKLDAVKERTDNLPDDPTSEAVATANKNEIISHGDAFWGTGAAGSNVVEITLKDADTQAPIPDVIVMVKNSDSSVTLDVRRTNASGLAVFLLDPNDGSNPHYDVYLSKPGAYTFDSLPKELVVDEDPEEVTYEGAAFSPSSSTPDVCVVYGVAIDGKGEVVPNAAVVATLSVKHATNENNQVVDVAVEAEANSQGEWEIPLVKNAKIYPAGTKWTIQVGDFEYSGLTVPDQASASLYDVIKASR